MYSIERLDQSHLYPNLEVPGLAACRRHLMIGKEGLLSKRKWQEIFEPMLLFIPWVPSQENALQCS